MASDVLGDRAAFGSSVVRSYRFLQEDDPPFRGGRLLTWKAMETTGEEDALQGCVAQQHVPVGGDRLDGWSPRSRAWKECAGDQSESASATEGVCDGGRRCADRFGRRL